MSTCMLREHHAFDACTGLVGDAIRWHAERHSKGHSEGGRSAHALDPKGALDEARAVGLLDGVDERGKGRERQVFGLDIRLERLHVRAVRVVPHVPEALDLVPVATGHLVAARGRELGLGDAREHALGGRGWEEDASTDSVREYAASSQKEHSSIETSS